MISIAEVKSGDELYFTEVFNRFNAKLYHYFLKKTRSPEFAKELVQLTFIKLWQFRHTLSEEHDFNLQIFNIACTTLIDHLRHQSSQRTKIEAMSETTGNPAGEGTAAVASGFEENDYLNKIIQSLSPARRKVFVLSRIHGHSYKEIAGQLSISVKTVEDHMVKAMRHIRTIASGIFFFLLLIIFLY